MTHANTAASRSDALTEAFEHLSENERWWMERSTFFESHGYQLRPRFRPGWVPSWRGTGKKPLYFEDARFHLVENIMDATRLSDGQKVTLKSVRRMGSEQGIATMFSSTDALADPMNHCVPILDCFGNPNVHGPDFIVMPLLRSFDDPNFYAISEILDFVQQTLEGLVYIHGRGVAHRDLSGANIMIDGSELFPDGSHPDPLWENFLHDQFITARALRRCEVKRVKYYFIDFGISSYFEDPLEPRLVTGIDGRDGEVPELDLLKPYDPFAVDAFCLGNTYKKLFAKYVNLDFLSPLIEEMTYKDPQERPTAEEALEFFHELADEASQSFPNKLLRRAKEPIIVHYVRELLYSWKTLPGVTKKAFTWQNVAFMTVPMGISVLVLFHGSNHRLFGRIHDLVFRS